MIEGLQFPFGAGQQPRPFDRFLLCIAVIACVDLNNRGVEPETCNLNIISDGLWRSCHACLNGWEPSGAILVRMCLPRMWRKHECGSLPLAQHWR